MHTVGVRTWWTWLRETEDQSDSIWFEYKA